MQPAAHLLRRLAPPAAASMPPPSPPPRSRARLLELPLPSALVPPKKRRVLRTPPKATTPIPPPPPPVPAAAGDVALPDPTPPPQAAAVGSPPAVDRNPTLPPPGAAEKPSSPPPPTAEKPSSPPSPPAADDEKPSSPPPPATKIPSSSSPPPPPPDAAANRAPTRKVRKVVRKLVPKGTIAARKAAAAGAGSAATAELQIGEGHAPDKSTTDRNAAVDEVVVKGKNLGGTAIKEPAAGCNSIAVCEAAIDREMVTDCGDAPEVEKLAGRDEVGMSERQRRRMTEVFVGGLNRDAKEEDVRAALAEAGEITEVRMIMDAGTKKNKGYCFVRYHEVAQARKAITEFGNVKICGKQCRVAALERNDKIFLGNIDKKWKKEDIMKLLQRIGVENIDVVTLMDDCNNPAFNRGLAFLELETYRDAQVAYRKLSRKDVFGKGLNIKVAWAEPLDDPNEKQMQQVKAVFVEGVPNSWDQAKMKEIFKKYGKIELVVLSRDMRLTKRNDIAFIHYTTHEAAVLCLQSFDGEQLTENGSKVNMKVALAKSVQKSKKDIEDHKCYISEKHTTNIPKSQRKLGSSSLHILPSSSRVVQITQDKKSSKTNGLLHVLRELAPWTHGHVGSAGSAIQDYPHIYSGEKRPFSALGNDSSYRASRNPRAQHESSTYATLTSSYGGLLHAITGYSPPYHQDTRRCLPDSDYGLAEPWGGIQMMQAGSRKPGQPHGSRH